MKFNQYCDLLIGNRPENDSDDQYYECEECYRFEICKEWYELQGVDEQVNCLRRYATSDENLYDVLNEAADTIESLSAKLQAANIEQSAEDCGGWIECESGKLPDKEVICCDVCGEIIIGYIYETYESEQTGFSAENNHECMYNCVKWTEKPTP